MYMRSPISRRTVWIAGVMLLVLPGFSALPASAQAETPIGTFESVDGVAWVRSKGSVFPAQTLGAIAPGDTVLVESGEVTIFDLCTGQRYRLGAPTQFPMQASACPPKHRWLESLRDRVRSAARRQKIVTAVTRSYEHSCLPHGDSYSPESHVVFEWHPDSMSEAPAASQDSPWGQIIIKPRLGSPAVIPLTAADLAGFKVWPAEVPCVAGEASWQLKDGAGLEVCTGEFVILSGAAVDSLRRHYLEAAQLDYPDSARTVAAALLAAKDNIFLW